MTQEENIQFWRELWDFVSSQKPIFSRKLIGDIYQLGKNIEEGISVKDAYLCVRWCAFSVAKELKKELPAHLHARMVLGEQTPKTKQYIEMCWVAKSIERSKT